MLSNHTKTLREGGLVCLIGLALVSATLGCYWPAGHFGFLHFDDPQNVSMNLMVQQGLRWPSIVWAFKSIIGGNWQPLTSLSHMLDCQLWGSDAGRHHLTNVLIHTANVLLLFLVLRRMTGAVWRSGFVAALFGWHPMHVESVAWISERKDMLSGLFFLLTLWAYCRYVECAGRRPKSEAHHATTGNHALAGIFYVMAVGFDAMGLMSKPMLVTVPFVLLLLDLWPFGRLAWPRFWSSHHTTGPESNHPSQPIFVVRPLRLICEKLPFFALSAAACILAFIAQKDAGAVSTLGAFPVALRMENALTSYAVYLGKLFWPGDMAAMYPYDYWIPLWQAAGAGILLGVVSAGVVWQLRKQPWLAVGWFWFIGMLVPVIGLVQVGEQSRADRYTYLPYIGLGLMLAWGVPALLEHFVRGDGHAVRAEFRKEQSAAVSPTGSRRLQVILGLAGLVALGGCWLGARAQLQYWQDSVTLFRHAVQVTSHNEAALNILGRALAQQGRIGDAIAQFQEALRIDPAYSRFRHETCDSLGRIYLQQHKPDEAIALFSEALQINPAFADARMRLGLAYAAKGEMDKADAQLKLAAETAPGDMAVQGEFAVAMVKSGKSQEAFEHFQALVAAHPDDPALRFMLAGVYVSLNRTADAISSIKEALRRAPNTPAYMNQLARLLATVPEAGLRNGIEAVSLAERACALTRRQNAGFLDTLSAAYAEAGRFPDAIKAAQEARTVALASKDQEAAEAAARKVQLYRTGKPYREVPTAD